MPSKPPGRTTRLLNRMSAGDADVSAELMELIYSELHKLAQVHMAREDQGHTLQPTALVNEAYLRLVGRDGDSWESRRQFYAMSSKIMRSLLVDHARAKRTKKRGGDRLRMPLEEETPHPQQNDVDVLDLHAALEALAALDGELAHVIELRFFGGLAIKEISATMDLPVRTIERRLKVANAWLHDHLEGRQEG